MKYIQMIREYFQSAEDVQNMTCGKCNSKILYDKKDIKIHYHTGYECHTVKCPYCKRINIIGYVEQYGFDVNNDIRFYQYKKD